MSREISSLTFHANTLGVATGAIRIDGRLGAAEIGEGAEAEAGTGLSVSHATSQALGFTYDPTIHRSRSRRRDRHRRRRTRVYTDLQLSAIASIFFPKSVHAFSFFRAKSLESLDVLSCLSIVSHRAVAAAEAEAAAAAVQPKRKTTRVQAPQRKRGTRTTPPRMAHLIQHRRKWWRKLSLSKQKRATSKGGDVNRPTTSKKTIRRAGRPETLRSGCIFLSVLHRVSCDM